MKGRRLKPLDHAPRWGNCTSLRPPGRLSIEEIERHWLDQLDLPESSLRKHTLNHMPTSSSGRAKNKLPYGVCTLRVHNTWMLHHIYGAIQEYGAFDEPAWLR